MDLVVDAGCALVTCVMPLRCNSYSGLKNRCEATVFEHTVDVTLQGVGIALSACSER